MGQTDFLTFLVLYICKRISSRLVSLWLVSHNKLGQILPQILKQFHFLHHFRTISTFSVYIPHNITWALCIAESLHLISILLKISRKIPVKYHIWYSEEKNIKENILVYDISFIFFLTCELWISCLYDSCLFTYTLNKFSNENRTNRSKLPEKYCNIDLK